jgi:ABC-type polysaccharide/polyol phosphate export permease
MVLSVFSGVFYPVSNLPNFLRIFSRVIPASYVFESMRAILARGLFSSRLVIYLCIGLVLSCIYLLVTYFFFIRVYRYNLKHGTIARFNIE